MSAQRHSIWPTRRATLIAILSTAILSAVLYGALSAHGPNSSASEGCCRFEKSSPAPEARLFDAPIKTQNNPEQENLPCDDDCADDCLDCVCCASIYTVVVVHEQTMSQKRGRPRMLPSPTSLSSLGTRDGVFRPPRSQA